MFQLLFKTLIRSLAIFISIGGVSYITESFLKRPDGVNIVNIGVAILVLIAVTVGLVLWAQSIKVSKNSKSRRLAGASSLTGKQH